jgi:hypothetical protein
MHQDTQEQYKGILTELIKKQMVILGPDITLLKVKNVKGITIASDGAVTSLEGDPKLILQNLINEFVELSGMIVKKVMESIIASNPGVSALTELSQNVSGNVSSLGIDGSSDAEKDKIEQEKAQQALNEATQSMQTNTDKNGSGL